MRLIDADALLEKVLDIPPYCGHCDGYGFVQLDCVQDAVEYAPTIEAEPVKHGRWDNSGRYKFADGSLAIRCSECGACIHEEEYEQYFWNYCPNCGAKMDLEET